MEELPIIPCGVALVRRGREFLIAQRNERDTFGSFWEFPGGKKMDEETFEECIAREVKEEVGIDIVVQEKLMDIRKKYKNRIIWLHFYLCAYVSGEPRPLDCQRAQWVDVMKLKDFRFPPANELVIEKLTALVNTFLQSGHPRASGDQTKQKPDSRFRGNDT